MPDIKEYVIKFDKPIFPKNVELNTVASADYFDTYVETATLSGNTLILHRNDNVDIPVDLSSLVIPTEPTEYRIVIKDTDYTTIAEDYDGRTIILANSASDQTITLSKPSSELIGKTIIVRRSNKGTPDKTFEVSVVPGDGVTINPDDAKILRRNGSTYSFVYLGDGKFELFGELL